MSIYLYYEKTASEEQMDRARTLLVELGYKEHPAIPDSYLHLSINPQI